MATNLALDDALIESAVRVGKHPSKKAAVTRATGRGLCVVEQGD